MDQRRSKSFPAKEFVRMRHRSDGANMRDLTQKEMTEVSGGIRSIYDWSNFHSQNGDPTRTSVYTRNVHTPDGNGGYAGTTVIGSRPTNFNQGNPFFFGPSGEGFTDVQFTPPPQPTGPFSEEGPTSDQEARQAAIDEQERRELCNRLEADRIRIESRLGDIDEQFSALGFNEPGANFAEFAEKIGPMRELTENMIASNNANCHSGG